jgi:dCMP deaminase
MNDNWKNKFFALTEQIGSWSKDPSKKIGAVAVDPKTFRVLATGYNGFPRGIFDSDERLNNRPLKYKYVVHAEMNVIYNACLNGVSLQGAELFVTGLPVCSECAKGIIQCGISKVYIKSDNVPDNWAESFKLTKEMFDEAGVLFILC